MGTLLEAWPALEYAGLAPTLDHLNRLVQIGGKHTLSHLFEPGWGNIVYDVTSRGLRTPTLRLAGVTFEVHYRLLDGDVLVAADTGQRVLPLAEGTVSDFYAVFVEATGELRIPPPRSAVTCEIADGGRFESDHVVRPWDPAAARTMWAALTAAAGALEDWQAPYRGHRPRVGVMWGGFDLSATRYRGVAVVPPAGRAPFMQHGMAEEYVSVGFTFGSAAAPSAGMYAYIAPQPDGLEGRSWGPAGAAWHPDLGLALLPWESLRAAEDPRAEIVSFGDAVYAVAGATAGWSAELVGPRFDGWHASRNPPGTA